MIRAKSVAAIENQRLLIEFDTGEKRIFDCKGIIREQTLYKVLDEKAYFEKVYVDEMGIIAWEEGLDLDPYIVYEESKALK